VLHEIGFRYKYNDNVSLKTNLKVLLLLWLQCREVWMCRLVYNKSAHCIC